MSNVTDQNNLTGDSLVKNSLKPQINVATPKLSIKHRNICVNPIPLADGEPLVIVSKSDNGLESVAKNASINGLPKIPTTLSKQKPTTNLRNSKKLTVNETNAAPDVAPDENTNISKLLKLTEKVQVELLNNKHGMKNYQTVIETSSIENELLKYGYMPVSRIVVTSENGSSNTQYIKATNKNGQKVFVQLDVAGYSTARSNDLTFMETNKATIVPYSIKQGALNCVGIKASGVAFECGTDAVCVLSRDDDMQPKETNYVYIEKKGPAPMLLEHESSIIAYPVVKLSEIKVNADLILKNTDDATRNLRNTTYTSLLRDLFTTQNSIIKLWQAFKGFDEARYNHGIRLNSSLTKLEQFNEVYTSNPPLSDTDKENYRHIQYNLMLRNDWIVDLLKAMKKVSDKHNEINNIAKEIMELTEYLNKEFSNVDVVNVD
jgi:hypothetical protein